MDPIGVIPLIIRGSVSDLTVVDSVIIKATLLTLE
jgi:hypothetical protein